MKKIFCLIVMFAVCSCNIPKEKATFTKEQIDSLETYAICSEDTLQDTIK